MNMIKTGLVAALLATGLGWGFGVQAQEATIRKNLSERVPQLPNVPTAREHGFAQVEAYTWQGLVVPAGMPRDIQARLKAINITLD